MKKKKDFGFSSSDNTYKCLDGTVYKLTEEGIKNIKKYIEELKAKRKEILDAKLDTVDETEIPQLSDVLIDAIFQGFDEEGTSYNCWGVTDHYNADNYICLELGEDVLIIN